MMAIQTRVLVRTPTVPNFIQVGKEWVGIGELSEATLKEIAKDWTHQLLIKADERRKRKS